MKIIDLLNKIANGEEDLPKRIEYRNKKFVYDKDNQLYIVENYNEYNDLLMELSNHKGTDLLYEVEILEEEKKIPERHINDYGDLIILGQQDNWLEPTIETDQKINAQLNPYVFEAINENFKDIANKIYEIIDCLDYLKSKGE